MRRVVVVVGAACRDLVDDDPRGWRLGGGVTYAALTLARLGLPVGALIGADRLAAESRELHLLRDAGVDVVVAPLGVGPGVHQHRDAHRPHPARAAGLGPGRARRPAGGLARRVRAGCSGRSPRSCRTPGRPSRRATRWSPSAGRACCGSSWRASAVTQRPPGPSPIVRRSDLVGVGRDDIEPGDARVVARSPACIRAPRCCSRTAREAAWRSRPARMAAMPGAGRGRRSRSSTSWIRSGPGDTFLAGVFAAHVDPSLRLPGLGPDADLLVGAAAASLICEGPGLLGVPPRDAVLRRMSAAAR